MKSATKTVIVFFFFLVEYRANLTDRIYFVIFLVIIGFMLQNSVKFSSQNGNTVRNTETNIILNISFSQD